MRKRKTTFNDLVKVMAQLRKKCPWDREQTHESLLKYLREESAEVADAVRKKDWDNLHEELGDLLLQILFHAEIAQETGKFDIQDVLTTLKEKLIRRHPHVFGTVKQRRMTADDVKRQWAVIKKKEKKAAKEPKKGRGSLL